MRKTAKSKEVATADDLSRVSTLSKLSALTIASQYYEALRFITEKDPTFSGR